MSEIVWDNKFRTGVEPLDIQRREIFDYMATIYNELVHHHMKSALFKNPLMKLHVLCRIHFKKQEDYLETIKHPSGAHHKQIHELLLGNMGWFITDAKHFNALSIQTFFSNVREDIITHFLNEAVTLGSIVNDTSNSERDISFF